VTPAGLLLRRHAPLLAVLALATGVRLVFHHDVRAQEFARLTYVSESDAYWYDRWAREIAAGDVLGRDLSLLVSDWQARVGSDAEWRRWFRPPAYNPAPLYLYLVAGVYALAGPRPEAVFAVQLGLGVCAVALVYAAGARAFGRAAGLAAAVLAAVYAPLVFYEGTLLRTVPIAVLELAVLVAALRADASGRPLDFALLGATGGAALLAQPTSALLLLLCGGFSAARRVRDPRRAGAVVVAVAGGLVLALLPLWLRNAAVGAPVFALESRGPFALVFGNVADSPTRAIGFSVPDSALAILRETDYRLLPGLRAALATFDSPQSFALFELGKLAAAFSDFEIYNNLSFYYFADRSPLLGALPRFAAVAGLGAAGIGLALARRRDAREPGRRGAAIAGLYLAYGVLSAIVSVVLARYRIPLACALILFGGAALAEAVSRARRRELATPLALVGGAIAASAVALADAGVSFPRDRVQEPIAWARSVAREGDPGRAVAEIERALASFRGDPRQIPKLHRAAAQLYRGMGDAARAAAHAAAARAASARAREDDVEPEDDQP
jgi:4-amino-4-deoxy-L-arabinose transferase-like glycosyltransferase